MQWIMYSERTFMVNALSSAIFFLTVVLLRLLVVRAIQGIKDLTVENRRRWIVSTRNGLLLLLISGLFFIWAQEIRAFAVSLLAVAVALVLATKELILCVSGTILKTGTNAFSIGDRIEIGGFRGDVVDESLFSTTLLEIGPGKKANQRSGRSVVIPNSLLLNTPLANENFMGNFVFHTLTIRLSVSEDWKTAEKELLRAAEMECEPFLKEAQGHMKRLETADSLDAPSAKPRVSLKLLRSGRLNLLLRFPVKAQAKGRVEQAILRRFLDRYTPLIDKK